MGGDAERAEWDRRRYGARWAEGVYDEGWLRWLHERHSIDELRGWATRLDVFRYCRAVGGQANDVDHLMAALRVDDDVLAAIGLTSLAEPGWVEVGGHSVHAGVQASGELLLLIAPEDFDVTEREIRVAEELERLLAPVADRVIDPPWPNPHCVCPQYYPELWHSSR